MDPKFMWDFSHMFETKEAWEAAYAECEADIAKLSSLAGTLCASAESLKTALDTVYAASKKMELVYLYAMLHQSSDNGDPEYQAMQGRAINLIVAMNTAIAFLEPEILECDEQTVRSYLEQPELAVYRQTVGEILRGRAHMLPKEQEMMLAMLSDVRGNARNIFEMLESVDMTFPPMIDENGNEAPLTHGNFGVWRESADKRIRHEAFIKYFGEFKK
jgi:oligoendopeptidase F